MSQSSPDESTVLTVKSYFVRKRNALLVRANFTALYIDYYLHLMQHQIEHAKSLDTKLKDALAAMTLHLCSRPQDETAAWTIHIHRPLMNLFVTGNSRPGNVVGRIFTEDIRDEGKGLFISQVTRPNTQPRQSIIEVQGNDVLEMVEHFYTQSEQRLTRFFPGADDELVMLSAEPDCDEDWLMALAPDELPVLEENEHLSLLETRFYTFGCGCSEERLFPLLSRLTDDDLTHIFADGAATITCPRCAAVYRTPVAQFELWRQSQA